MVKFKCCFGCTNSRNCAWVISFFNMFVCVVLVLPILQNLSYISYTHSSIHRLQDLLSKNFLIFNLLCMVVLLFYINLYLNKATYTHNVQSVHHWLVTMWIFFIFLTLYICFTAFVNRFPHLITIGIPVSTVVAYQIHVVKKYYDIELEFVSAAAAAVVVDGRDGGGFVVGPPPPLQSVVASSALFPVQAGGPAYVIHQQQPPSSAYPATLSVYQYSQQQQQHHQHLQQQHLQQQHLQQQHLQQQNLQLQQHQQRHPRSHVVQVERSDDRRHEPTRDSNNSPQPPSYSSAATDFNSGPPPAKH